MPPHSHRGRSASGERRAPLVLAVLMVVLGAVLVAVPLISSLEVPSMTAGDGSTARTVTTAGSWSATPLAPAPQTVAPRRAPLERVAPKARPRAGRTTDGAPRSAGLARRAERLASPEPEPEPEPEPVPAPFDVRVGTFNVLGSQHTAPGGDRQRFPPASQRTAGAARLLAEHGVEVLGTQELQADQLRDLQSRTGLAAWPGFGWGEAETDNSVLYDDQRFELVSGDRFTITFMGRPRPQPIVRLRERATGRELFVVNTHPSAGGGRYLAERRRGQDVLVDVVAGLKQTGLPVLVTGDMNDREEFYCRVVPAAGLAAANGGSYGSGCAPPPSPLPVDWVVGGGPLTWSRYWRDTRPVTQRISDHFLISATASVR